MTFRIILSQKAKDDIGQCFAYLSAYSSDFAQLHSENLERLIYKFIPQNPYTWNYFHITDEPFRAYLYKIGKRTQYWVVYYINEEAETIEVLRFWQASQDPNRFSF